MIDQAINQLKDGAPKEGIFWDKVNKPFLDAAIQRGDEIYLATKPEGLVLLNSKNPNGLSGFGMEFEYLKSQGYVYQASTGRMCLGGCK